MIGLLSVPEKVTFKGKTLEEWKAEQRLIFTPPMTELLLELQEEYEHKLNIKFRDLETILNCGYVQTIKGEK